MAKKKLKWTDVEDIAFRLIDLHPQKDPLKARFTDLHKWVTSLPEFSDNPKNSNEKILEAIQMRWFEERNDMEDELGPLSSSSGDEDLDEDDYRDDLDADDSDQFLDDDEDDDEMMDGFHEEGEGAELDDR